MQIQQEETGDFSRNTMEVIGLEKPIVSDEYMLMPGDKILVTITGTKNYSYESVITYEGKVTINMPVASFPTAQVQGVYIPEYDIVDAVSIYGLNLNSAKDSLRRVFLKYYKNVDVNITLIEMRIFSVFVVGEIKEPGIVQAWPVDRVSEVVKRAGGVSTFGSYTQVELRRNGKLYRIVNLEEFDRSGDTAVNPTVQNGDIIYVPRMKKSVIVRGAVFGKRDYELRVAELTASRERTSEGLYELGEGERVSDLITKAGGITPWADLENTYVLRGDKKINTDLTKILADENCPENVLLKDGDIVVIPSMNALVYVQGRVVNPGSFPFQPHLRASDYIGLAGGPENDANMHGAYVQRGKKRISVRKDPIIEQGDRIFVPRQVFKFWQDYVKVGSFLVTLLLSYRTLTRK